MVKKLIYLLIVTTLVFSMTSCAILDQLTEKASNTEQLSQPPAQESEPVPEPENTPESPAPENSWQKAYADFLRKGGNIDSYTPKFALIYIDNNDIPELVIGEGDYHAAGAYLYTVSDNIVVPILLGEHKSNRFGDYGSISYKERKGIVHTSSMGMGYVGDSIVQIEGKNAEYVIRLSNDEGAVEDPADATYTVNDKNVTKDEYYRALYNTDFTGYTSVYFSDMYDLTEININRLLPSN